MNKLFENAYNAVSALHSISEHVKVVGGSAIHSCAEIIGDEIDAIPYSQVKFDSRLQARIDSIAPMLHAVSMQAFNVEEDEAYADAVEALARVLFRCVSDLQDDLNGEERFDWMSGLDHWAVAKEWYGKRHESEAWKLAA